MDFDLNEEQQLFKNSVRHFMETEVEPGARERYASEDFPYEIIKKAGEFGLLGTPISREYGGGGESILSYAVQMEEIARVDLALHGTIQVHLTMACLFLSFFGTEDQKRRYLPLMARGEQLGSFGLTEPSAGSDAAAIKTRAHMNNGDWVINGSKCLIMNSGTDISNGVIILAVTGADNKGKKEFSSFFVPKGSPGFTVAPKNKLHGARWLDNHSLSFEECRVSKDNFIGELGKGLHQFLHILDYARVIIAAGSVGVIQRCLEEAVKYSQNRVQFNKPIFDFQSIQNKLADMALNLELARMITHKASFLADEGKTFTREAACAKLFSSEAAEKAATEAVQIFGGNGFMEEYAIGRFFGDVKLHQIGEGTSEIMRMIIARGLKSHIH